MKWLALLCGIALTSCASTRDGLTVKQYHLRENMFNEDNDMMVRGEVQRYLHGAVTKEERKQKAGQYYHVIWQEKTTKAEPVEVVFEYLQTTSGSTVKRQVEHGTSSGVMHAYFTINGNDYATHGRVLAWRCSVKKHGDVVASKKSYMWR